MNLITLTSNTKSGVTPVSNRFIDSYMPAANGSFVKVYLFLLRYLNQGEQMLSISLLADFLDNTEKDIIRAIQYWEKVKLLFISRDKEGSIIKITLNESAEPVKEIQPKTVESSISAVLPPLIKELNSTAIERPTYTNVQIEELTKTDEVKDLLETIESKLNRLLKPMDIQLILYIYETLGFSVELIAHLYEYCISKNKTRIPYIESVAISWAEEGIDTIEKAEESIETYNKTYNMINKAFGLHRSPGDIEKQYIDKWSKVYEIDIIVEACNRSLLLTNQPNFKYANTILENWKKTGVKKISDIGILDTEHKNRVIKKAQFKKEQKAAPKIALNQFNAFPQRNYTKEDYSALEQKLLQK